MTRKGALGAMIIAAAVAAALLPIPPDWIEGGYSRTVYPIWQSWITTVSNAVPIALLDVLILGTIAAWLIVTGRDIARRSGWGRTTVRIVVRTAVWAAALYLIFLGSWGLNYRRPQLSDTLDVDFSRVSTANLRTLVATTVDRLNALHGPAHAAGWPAGAVVGSALPAAFAAAQRDLGAAHFAVPGRPKQTLLNPYFRRAVVDGMTDPFFLETLVVSDLLPFERPFILGHEWAHLAGYADEGEANFVGWLACMHADEPSRYSGWVFLFSEASAQLPRSDRQALEARLNAGPRDDFRAISARVTRNRSVRVSEAGWRVYNQYLKANRVEAGAASYGEVIRLILGTKLGQGF